MIQSYRSPVYCDNGVVVSPHYLASMAGAQVLREGGNALDAAIAANAVLGVVWPHMCGIGGDLFLLLYRADEHCVYGLNASGRSSAHATVEGARALGHATIPTRGGISVSVPGAVDGWVTSLERFGTLGLDRALAPAIDYAERGFPISAWLSFAIENKLPVFREHAASLAIFAPNGEVLLPGDRLRNPHLAATLRRIAAGGRAAFYEDDTASRIARTVSDAGGFMDEADLGDQRSDWVEPLSLSYRGVEVLELPPNTQGVTALQMIGLSEGFDLATEGHNSAQAIHLMVESKRIAFADRDAYLADSSAMAVPAIDLLDRSYLRRRRSEIDPRTAMSAVNPGRHRADGDTIYLCAVDRDGNAVSLIQSLFYSFGSGLVAEGTGVVLHNRGASFSLDPQHPNALQPRKRPMHTLIPAMALRDGRPAIIFGTRGADGQPQTQLQVLSNLVDFGMDVQTAVEAPRWVHGGPGATHPPDTIVLESRVPEVERVATNLRERGHQVIVSTELDLGMGTAQAIVVDPRGFLAGGSDPRGDGAAIGW